MGGFGFQCLGILGFGMCLGVRVSGFWGFALGFLLGPGVRGVPGLRRLRLFMNPRGRVAGRRLRCCYCTSRMELSALPSWDVLAETLNPKP